MMDMENKNYHRITVAEMAPHVHSFLPNENKVEKILNWLINWITLSLDCGKIKPYDLLPSKADLACHIGVSQGTVQNVFRLLEDAGYVESKQRIGTYIKDKKKDSNLEKLTSKRELAIEIVKKYLSENDYKEGDILISTRKLAQITGISNTTLRMAVTNLVSMGILGKKDKNFVVISTDFQVEKIQMKTLVEKVAENLKNFIKTELKTGDKLPANSILTKRFKVSIKTIHDAIKLLTKEGLLYTRRGQYGTIVAGENDKVQLDYFYEKFEQKIRHYIATNCQVGDKLPSIREFAQNFGTSEKTIKKALDNLAEDGYLTFSRGRYGGTFVMDIPQSSGEAYKWLAISTDYIPN